MNRVDRLFGIMMLLQSKKHVTAEKIADKFGMSVRTVYRDIKSLGELGIPVGFEQPKGYFIMQGFFLPPVSFTTDEANALLLMEAMTKGFADKSITNHYSSALDKVKAVLRTAEKEKVDMLSNNIKFRLPERFNQDYEYLSLIQNAVATKRMVRLEYKNNLEENSKREVEPIGLVFYAFSWHLIGWCHLRNKYRDFKVSRITKLCVTDVPFKMQEHMPLSEYMKELPVSW